MRASINGLGVLDITDRKLNAIQADVNDVIMHRRSATDTVLEMADHVLGTRETGAAYRELMEERMLRLMEACGFQDLTGQHLSRAAETLNALEERLKKFAQLVRPQTKGHEPGLQDNQRNDWHQDNLVHGPNGACTMNQAMIDRLLAGA